MKQYKTVIICLAVLLFLSPAAVLSREEGEKSLARYEDPVVAPASELSGITGAEIKKLSLFIWDRDAYKPVPFQVDERKDDGYYVYDQGPEANPEDGDGKYNGKDELVFMAWDTGSKAPDGEQVPCDPEKTLELVVEDPESKGAAYAYLAACKGEPGRSEKDYIRHEYDGERDWVKSGRYHFAEQRGEGFFDRLALQAKDGEVHDDLCDRIKGRGYLSALGNLVKLDVPESKAKAGLKAWIDGPVRVIHLMKGYLQFSIIKLDVGGHSQNLFYPNYFVTPITADMPINPGSVLSTFAMRYAIDWRQEFEGTRYFDPVNTEGVVIDGEMSQAEKDMDYQTGHDWYALAGPHGNMVVRMILPEKWHGIVPLKLYYVDDIEAADPPESEPGQRCAGFMLDAMIDIPAGKYTYYLYYMVPDKAPPGSVPHMLAILDNPLQVKSRIIH